VYPNPAASRNLLDLDAQFGELGLGDRGGDQIGPRLDIGLGDDLDERRVVC
jgi:hypothetical protein